MQHRLEGYQPEPSRHWQKVWLVHLGVLLACYDLGCGVWPCETAAQLMHSTASPWAKWMERARSRCLITAFAFAGTRVRTCAGCCCNRPIHHPCHKHSRITLSTSTSVEFCCSVWLLCFLASVSRLKLCNFCWSVPTAANFSVPSWFLDEACAGADAVLLSQSGASCPPRPANRSAMPELPLDDSPLLEHQLLFWFVDRFCGRCIMSSLACRELHLQLRWCRERSVAECADHELALNILEQGSTRSMFSGGRNARSSSSQDNYRVIEARSRRRNWTNSHSWEDLTTLKKPRMLTRLRTSSMMFLDVITVAHSVQSFFSPSPPIVTVFDKLIIRDDSTVLLVILPKRPFSGALLHYGHGRLQIENGLDERHYSVHSTSSTFTSTSYTSSLPPTTTTHTHTHAHLHLPHVGVCFAILHFSRSVHILS